MAEQKSRGNAHGISKVTCIGGGLIGAGWAAHFMRAGLDVVVYDPAAEREAFLKEYLAKAMPQLAELGMAPSASPSRVHFTANMIEALEGTDFVQESATENVDAKIKLIGEIDALTAPGVVIASSSSGFLAAHLRRHARHPERILIGHPFNPPYLVPLVEIAGGDVACQAAATASAFYRSTGCEVVALDKEIPGYIGNRIQFAVWREILYIMSQGVADLQAIDTAIAAGPAIRWAVIGPSSVFFLAVRDPVLYGAGIEGLADEMERGYLAPPSFQPDRELMQIYAEQVAKGIGANGQAELLEWRDAGVVAIRAALKRARERLKVPKGD
ncbi:3-hydroxyacyl-CoA dehydrogenase NAD-binding domain-containing protein [Mesorhizobium sp. VK24D]|uniref:3-hydroxyacyl-CoA dehydrogenase NAD-binding domain-containing protein n=1 Tax=Mesorhizobium album TaxID=3072314 RepID=A0ABU4YC28_9HYPH|nr:3-hydroxyacyl-CoA dehydrogenase NAD-binding domain-containing protein [Mesorhizobium sp. VK24D]MDX8483442.1 3-hydroxyacyl-CoA dehydrogenase NAD-binding domain-containing protein [Mesorhizobium sp. VK24D]